MGFQNTLYPYKVKIRSGDQESEVTGNAATAGKARKAIKDMLAQRIEEGKTESIVAFEFDGKVMPVEASDESDV